MVFEDDLRMVQVVSDVLRMFGYEVVTAENFYSAIAIWSEHAGAFDAAVVDYVLEDRTGIELAEYFWLL